MGDYDNEQQSKDAKISKAFTFLDEDEIKELERLVEWKGMPQKIRNIHGDLTTSGCCALVAVVQENELLAANTGDCRAILASRAGDDWQCVVLSSDHTAANASEAARVLDGHPKQERHTCIVNGRLLGRLVVPIYLLLA